MSHRLDRLKMILYPLAGRAFRVAFGFKPLKNAVVFSSFSGKQYGDNPKAISLKLHELYPAYKQIWLFRNPDDFNLPEYIQKVKYGSMESVRALMCSKVWVDSHKKPLWIKKRKGTYYIETWHGGLGFKKIEGDALSSLLPIEVEQSKHNSSMVDIMISNSRHLTNIYKRAFWYHGPILEIGFPKADVFFDKKYVSDTYVAVRKDLNIPMDVKLVLYAPTFRNTYQEDTYKIQMDQLLSVIEKRFQGQWIVGIKLHPVMTDKSDTMYKYSNKVMNLTYYKDMQSLIMATDIFITDYSSGIFDFALTFRPGFIYAKDYEEYVKNDRGFYANIKEMPFPFANSQEMLFQNVLNFDEDHYKNALKQYFDEVGLIQTNHSSEQVCSLINKYMEELI